MTAAAMSWRLRQRVRFAEGYVRCLPMPAHQLFVSNVSVQTFGDVATLKKINAQLSHYFCYPYSDYDSEVRTDEPAESHLCCSDMSSAKYSSDAANTCCFYWHTFEVAPVFVLMEKAIVQKLCDVVGFKNGDGVFGPASFLGLGADSVISVETDDRGLMKVDKLEELIIEDKQRNEAPMMLAATAGTTVLGAYDDLNAIADVCQRHGIWLHCDACWEGGALLSRKHRYLMAGVNRCDSVSWNLHKMSAAPLQCSVLLVQHKGLLEECNQYKKIEKQ